MIRAIAIAAATLSLLLCATSVTAQPRFAVEMGTGQNLGFTPYLDNVVIVDESGVPALADELAGTGAAFDARFVFSGIAVGGGVRFFGRETLVRHHIGTSRLPENRTRPDGTVDDAGIEYVAVEPERIRLQRRRGEMVIVHGTGGYRFGLLTGAFSLYVPVSGGFLGIKILEPNRPTVLGFQAETGLGMSYAIAPPIAVFATALVSGVLTPTYMAMSDTARTSYHIGESTEDAVLASMLYGTALIGLQLRIR